MRGRKFPVNMLIDKNRTLESTRVSTHTLFLTAHGYRLNDIREHAHICANIRAYYPFEHADTRIIRKYAHICATMRSYLVCVETLIESTNHVSDTSVNLILKYINIIF